MKKREGYPAQQPVKIEMNSDLLRSALRKMKRLKLRAHEIATSHVMIACGENNEVSFVGCNGEASLTIRRTADVATQDLKTCAPLAELFGAVETFTKNTVAKITASEKFTLLAENDEDVFELPIATPAEDFIQLNEVTYGVGFTIRESELLGCLRSCMIAVPKRDHRKVLLSVHAEVFSGKVRFTATDGKKLVRCEAAAETTGELVAEGKTNIPATVLDVLIPLLSNGDGFVTVKIAAEGSHFSFADTSLKAQSWSGKYPDCDAVIPKEFAGKIDLPIRPLLNAVKKAQVVVDDRNNTMILEIEGTGAVVRAHSMDRGLWRGRMTAVVDGPPLKVAFNTKFLHTMLGQFKNDSTVRLLHNGESRPVLFTGESVTGEWTRLLMPIKLADAEMKTTIDVGDDE